ncbi:SpaA isopeptide-forming pilin-related protein, partial [Ruminococcus flavefaciens]|uniref:SpaA isopeptide-forming pilin-related protein n=1 Tax=Ruminococcus flavefaciens TaxID=1265 RepID=UPI0026ED326F
MKLKKIIKRITSTILATAIGVSTVTNTLASAEAANPNPTHEATNINFSYTDGYIKYDAHAGYPFPNGTNDEKLWIIKPNNQTYGNLCIHPATSINSYTDDYYAYQVTSTGDANSSYWRSLSAAQQYTIGLLMHYGYPNGIEPMNSSQGATSGAAMDATQMLVWEAVRNTRVLPNDYATRDDYSGYSHMQYHYTNGKADYQYTSLGSLYYKLGAGNVVDVAATASTKAYYSFLVNKIVHHKDKPSRTYDTPFKAQANPTTLIYNKTTNRYEAKITVNRELFDDFGARTALGNIGINVVQQGETAANGNATFLLYSNVYFSGTKVTAEMIKQSTKAHANRTPYGTGLQIWAQKLTNKTNSNDTVSIQQTVTGSKADPVSAFMAVNAQEVKGDITVDKKTYDPTKKVDTTIDAEVKAAARFVVMEEGKASPNYVLATKQADGLYTYVSSDRYSNTSETQAATTMKLDANGKLKVTNLPLGKTFRVIEYQTGEHYKIDMNDVASRSVSFTLSEQNNSQTKNIGNYEEYEGRIAIEKTDDLGNVIPNVEFNITNTSTKATVTVKTDANGKATASHLPLGTYTVKETSVISPYVVNSKEQTVVLDGSSYNRTLHYEQKTVQVENKVQRATLNIVKVDDSTNQPIKNNPATFSIKVAEDYIVGNKTVLTKGTDIGTFKTDNNGVLEVENIYVNAKYTVTETIPPQNYKKVAPITVTAAWDKTVEHVTKEQPIGNDWQSGSINVFKYVKKAGTNRPLANAVFELKAAEDVLNPDGTVKYAKGKVIQSNVKTDAEGKASFTRVPVGFEYTVRETAAPTGYQNKHPQTKFKLEWNKDVEFVETDPVSIENKPINLYISKRILAESDDTKHINGTELKGAKMTIIAEDGTTFASWTSDGSEHLVEQIPAGKYKLVEITQPDGFIVATSIEFEIDDQNAVTVTDATVESKDDLPVIVMFDAVTHVDISKQDATTGSELAGAKLTLYDDKNNKVDEWTSTTKPHTIYGLVVGKTYRLHEDLQPLGYRKASDVKFTVEGRLENGKAKVQKVVMKDEVQVGGLEIYKKTPEQKNIANIEFRLKGTSTLGIEVDETARTDANGVAKFENIPVGKFTLTENGKTVNTEVYIVADPQNVEIKDDEIAKINIDNIEKEGTIQVQKRTEGNLNIEGIEFTLAGTSDSGRDIEIKGKTDKDGLCTFKNIPVGTYTITESDGTHFAYLVAEPQKVTVLYAQQTDVEFFNKEKEGTIQVQKRTEGNLNIEGIKFILTGKSDSGREIKVEATTDKDGVAKFSVPCGVYTITEDAESVPFAYMVAEPKSDVKVVYAQQTDVEFFNELKKGSIKVQKKTKDMTNIEGITFTLSGKSDAGTDVNITGKTDANGVVEFKDIPIGTYKITESDV